MSWAARPAIAEVPSRAASSRVAAAPQICRGTRWRCSGGSIWLGCQAFRRREETCLNCSVGCFMVVTRVFSFFVLALSLLSFAAKAQAADTPLTEMDPEIAKRFGEMIHQQFAKENKDAKPKFDLNYDKASGLFNAESNEGIIVIPAKNFKEDRENKEVEKDPGVGMCFVCMSQTYNPLIDGKPVDGKKAFQIKFDDGQGGAERVATCLLCSIRHLEGDDWELYVWGKDKDPIIKTNWGEANNAPKGDLALTIEDPKKDSATLVFNIFNKYSASIPI